MARSLGVDEYSQIIEKVECGEEDPVDEWMIIPNLSTFEPTLNKGCRLTLMSLSLTCKLFMSLARARLLRYVDLPQATSANNFKSGGAYSKDNIDRLPIHFLRLGGRNWYDLTDWERTDLTSDPVVDIFCRCSNLRWLTLRSPLIFEATRWRLCSDSFRRAGVCSRISVFDFSRVRMQLSCECMFDLLMMMPALKTLLLGPIPADSSIDSKLLLGDTENLTTLLGLPPTPPPFRLTTCSIQLGIDSVMRHDEVQRWLLSACGDIRYFALGIHFSMHAAIRRYMEYLPEVTSGNLLRLHLEIYADFDVRETEKCISRCIRLEELGIPLLPPSNYGFEALRTCLSAVKKPLRHLRVIHYRPVVWLDDVEPLIALIRENHPVISQLERLTHDRQHIGYGVHDSLREVCQEYDVPYVELDNT